VRSVLVLAIALALAGSGTAAAAPVSIIKAPIRSVHAGQGTIGYRSVGQGRPLVLIMGLSGTMDSWPPSWIDALARKRRVIVYDNEGIRRTTLGPAPLTIPRMASDVVSLARALHLKQVDVLGWSMGGMIAQSLVRTHPKLVRRLVLCATAPGDGKATLPTADAAKVLSDPTDQAGLLSVLFPASQGAALKRFIMGISSYPKATPMAPAAVMAQQLTASTAWITGKEPSGAGLKRLKLPVLVGAGGADHLLPAANGRHIAATIPGAKLKVYADAAHGFLFQHQQDFLARIQRFLG
jgi:pimeloyl-ACP methyl ester carboxylesterase